MIPIRATEEQFEEMVRNVIATYQKSTKEQRERGRTWYRNAHSLAVFLDETNPTRSAAIIAVLSANKRWADNVHLAEAAYDPDRPIGHTSDVVRKVARLMAGEPAISVLPFGLKTWYFFKLIDNPDDPDAVVIDRHAHDIAVGKIYGEENRGLSAGGRYDLLVKVYKTAAEKLSIPASVLQATVWVAHTERTR